MVEQITFLAVISYKVLVVIRLFGIVIFGTVVTHITNSVVVPIALVSISLPRTVVIFIHDAITVNVIVAIVSSSIAVHVPLPGVELAGTVVASVSPAVSVTICTWSIIDRIKKLNQGSSNQENQRYHLSL